MYNARLTRQTSLSPRLRRQYGLRLVREPLVVAEKVPHSRQITNASDVFSLMRPFAVQESAESFWAIPLNTQHHATAPVVITRGLLNASLVHPREVFRAMVAANAASIILCHNHPSGEVTPSVDDRKVTTQLVAAGRLLDLPILDHVIVSDVRYFSFAEHGLL